MDSNSQSDGMLLPRWLLGADESVDPVEAQLSALFEQFREPLFRYLLVVSRDAGEAEDLAQEAFLRLYQEMRARRPVEHAKSWLFRTGHNLAVDRHRARDGRFEDDLDKAAQHLVDERQPSSEEAMLRKERLGLMRAAVDRLSGQQRQCLHLRTEGFRYREIAAIMRVSESTVCENIRRGLARLMKEIHER